MTFFPNVTNNLLSCNFGGTFSKISLTVTIVVTLFGTSIPIVRFPGIGASILTSFTASAKASSR